MLIIRQGGPKEHAWLLLALVLELEPPISAVLVEHAHSDDLSAFCTLVGVGRAHCLTWHLVGEGPSDMKSKLSNQMIVPRQSG